MEWFDDYYDDCIESPNEADSVIAEAKEKLLGILKETVKENMEAAKEAEKKLESLNASIASKQRELSRVEEKLQDAISNAEKEELSMPQRYVDRFVRQYTGGFAAGDIVWIISKRYKRVECSMCHGDRKVSAVIMGEEKNIDCPTCRGSGIETKYEYEIKKKEIVDVYLKMGFSKDYYNRNARVWSLNTITLRGDDTRCSTEGLYRTREEAEERLKEMEAEDEN